MAIKISGTTVIDDSRNLVNINSGLGVGIQTVGSVVGYGVTLLDFRGAGISTITLDNNTGISTVNIEGSPAGQTIKESFAVTGLTTTFTLASSYTTGSLDIFLNGVKLNSADYTETDSTTIDLASPATDGDILEVVNSVADQSLVYSIATYASTAGIATLSTTSQGLTGTPNITVGDVTANDVTVNTLTSSGIVTGTFYYGDGSNLTNIEPDITSSLFL